MQVVSFNKIYLNTGLTYSDFERLASMVCMKTMIASSTKRVPRDHDMM